MEMRERLQRLSFCFFALAKEWKIKTYERKAQPLVPKISGQRDTPKLFP